MGGCLRSVCLGGGRRNGNELGTVNEFGYILADNGELLHSVLEVCHHQFLIVYHTLPSACRALDRGLVRSLVEYSTGK